MMKNLDLKTRPLRDAHPVAEMREQHVRICSNVCKIAVDRLLYPCGHQKVGAKPYIVP